MTTMVGGPALLATNETRVEGREKVRGQALYAADMQRLGMLWAAFVTSPHPHAKIVRIDTTTICGTDLHILKGDVPAVTPGRILGHEGVGVITEVGSSVTKLAIATT